MLMNPFRRQDDAFPLVVGMAGVKMGDRLVHIGCANAAQVAAVAGKVGLSGRAVAVVSDQATAASLQRAASRAGVLIETEVAPPDALPVEDTSFDFAIIDDGAGMLGQMSPAQRSATVREAARVLRPGGRIMVIGSTPRTGLGALLSRALLSRAPATPPFDPTATLQADVFRTVRTLAERDGYVFYEGLKPRA
jgi:ubiquinone/menaquinone biosynthesis C-methylase UbiE